MTKLAEKLVSDRRTPAGDHDLSMRDSHAQYAGRTGSAGVTRSSARHHRRGGGMLVTGKLTLPKRHTREFSRRNFRASGAICSGSNDCAESLALCHRLLRRWLGLSVARHVRHALPFRSRTLPRP